MRIDTLVISYDGFMMTINIGQWTLDSIYQNISCMQTSSVQFPHDQMILTKGVCKTKRESLVPWYHCVNIRIIIGIIYPEQPPIAQSNVGTKENNNGEERSYQCIYYPGTRWPSFIRPDQFYKLPN